MQRFRAAIRAIGLDDVLLVVGVALLAHGLSILHPALPFVGVGLLFVAAGAGVGRGQ